VQTTELTRDELALAAYGDILTDAQRRMGTTELVGSITTKQREQIYTRGLPTQRAAATFLHSLGAAMVLERRTRRRWRINRQRYAAACAEHNIMEDDLAEGGVLRDPFDQYIAQVNATYAPFPSSKLRFLADSLFGPNGSLDRNLMVRGNGQKFI
jgi:hypothetical protein